MKTEKEIDNEKQIEILKNKLQSAQDRAHLWRKKYEIAQTILTKNNLSKHLKNRIDSLFKNERVNGDHKTAIYKIKYKKKDKRNEKD